MMREMTSEWISSRQSSVERDLRTLPMILRCEKAEEQTEEMCCSIVRDESRITPRSRTLLANLITVPQMLMDATVDWG